MLLYYDTYTDVGTRVQNDDAILAERVAEEQWLFAVADGLGGHDNGRMAADTAIGTVLNYVHKGGRLDWQEIFNAANSSVLKLQAANKSNTRTTLAVLYIDRTSTFAVHVGDTRIYAFKNGSIVYQSKDHSVSQMAVYAGEIKPTEIRNHPDRNLLTKVIGNAETIKADIHIMNSSDYDALLLCSDGFWEYVMENEMGNYHRDEEPVVWLSRLRKKCVERADKCGIMDNNSAIAVVKGMGDING